MSKELLESGVIKQLKKQFNGKGESRGFYFTQILSSDKAFVYKIDTGDMTYYEVFKRVLNQRFDTISYPTSRAFGIWAWTYMKLDNAIEKFNEINKPQIQKK